MDKREMIKLGEIKNFDSTIPENILTELQMYSTFKVENEVEDNHIVQRYYVPKKEKEFYDLWKECIAAETLKDSNQNAVLLRNIARRHRLRLEK